MTNQDIWIEHAAINSLKAIFDLLNAKTHLELNWSVELRLEEAYTIPTTQPGPGYL